MSEMRNTGFWIYIWTWSADQQNWFKHSLKLSGFHIRTKLYKAKHCKIGKWRGENYHYLIYTEFPTSVLFKTYRFIFFKIKHFSLMPPPAAANRSVHTTIWWQVIQSTHSAVPPTKEVTKIWCDKVITVNIRIKPGRNPSPPSQDQPCPTAAEWLAGARAQLSNNCSLRCRHPLLSRQSLVHSCTSRGSEYL